MNRMIASYLGLLLEKGNLGLKDRETLASLGAYNIIPDLPHR